MRWPGERVVIVGAGVSGVAAARVFTEEGAEVRVSDERRRDAIPAIAELERLGVELRLGGHEAEHLSGATLVYLSPGIAPQSRVLSWARDLGIPIWGELELGSRICDAQLIAVTGTNGKTTTTGMIAACLRAGGVDAVACGNIGHPFPIAAREGHEALVVEASSFQLEHQESFHPKVSVLLNVAPDHLDWHGSLAAYRASKARLYANQGEGDTHVGNRDDPSGAAISSAAPCPRAWFTCGEPSAGEVGYVGAGLVSRIGAEAQLGSVGDDRAGYRSDAAAAAAAALSFGVPPGAILRGLAGFEPAAHRGELVASTARVRFVDNSKATNVHATLASLAVVSDVVLIAGGRAKGVDLAPLASMHDRLRGVVAIGEAADELVDTFQGLVPVRKAGSIEEATRTAFELCGPGTTVLLAPACASWDQFKDYKERGDRFTAAARGLVEEAGARG